MSKEKPPPILYHYTSQEGLLGIIRNKEIWATKISYLNDTIEYKYAINLTSEIIKDRQKTYSEEPPPFFSDKKENTSSATVRGIPLTVPSGPERYGEEWIEYNMLDDFCELIPRFEEYHVFVFSLSENGNLLSQWRGYCPHGGYSIGFNTSTFSKLMKKKGLIFVKCIYKRDDQVALINNIIDNYLKDIRSKSGELSDSVEMRMELISEYLAKVLTVAPKLKSESFKEESEWRIVTVPLKETNFIKFREGKSTIIPYIRINIDDNGNMPIEEVIISPSSHKLLSNNAVKLLLSTEEIESCRVNVSGISYQSP